MDGRQRLAEQEPMRNKKGSVLDSCSDPFLLYACLRSAPFLEQAQGVFPAVEELSEEGGPDKEMVGKIQAGKSNQKQEGEFDSRCERPLRHPNMHGRDQWNVK